MSSSAIAGASTGATVGSAVPGLGTAAGAAIGAGVGILSDVGGYFVNKGSVKRQYKYNLRLMDHQNDLNRQNWLESNSYNTPIAQRERLRAAGLNPDLMYQNGAAGLTAAAVSPVSGSSVSQQSPADFHGVANGAAMALQLQNVAAQGDVLKEEARRKSMENRVYAAEHGLDGGQTVRYVDKKDGHIWSSQEAEKWRDEHPSANLDSDQPFEVEYVAHRNIGELQYDKAVSDLNVAISNNNTQMLSNKFTDMLNTAKISNPAIAQVLANMPLYERNKLFAEVNELASRVRFNNKQIEYLGQLILESQSKVDLNNSILALNDEQKEVFKAQAAKIRNSDFAQALDKLANDKSMDFADKFLYLCGLVINAFANVAH